MGLAPQFECMLRVVRFADPVDKNTAYNIIEWIDDYVEDPEGTREELDMMNSEFNKEFKDD